jgi:regulator of protease activity HflC (stomatin/prohibitin superfamily)
MAGRDDESVTHERTVTVKNGWLMLAVNIAIAVAGVALLFSTIASVPELRPGEVGFRIIAVFLTEGLAILLLLGHFTLQPNESRVLILFGSYKGTVRRSGFHWGNPFYSRSRGRVSHGVSHDGHGESSKRPGSPLHALTGRALPTKVSLRAHNFNSDRLKVNDRNGNPVEIAAVIVWRVSDTAQAVFDVEDYESYVEVQAESALRRIASLYAYDQGEEDEITLRGGGDEVSLEIKKEVQERLETAGVLVEEARITHLAYAPEIASAMLRRQQAEAVIAARAKIVLGAVSMVEMALGELESKGLVDLDPERKAAIVSNLLVVLCGTSEAAPVINTGTLYN